MPKRILNGVVTSDQNAQTVTVSVELKVGDKVRIQECPPKSKTKRWEVIAS